MPQLNYAMVNQLLFLKNNKVKLVHVVFIFRL